MASGVLALQASGIVKADGTVSMTFQAPPTGLVYTGTMYISGSPPGAQWSATVMGVPWAQWFGGSVAGPIQAYPGMACIVTGAGMPAGTMVAANWSGSVTDTASTEPISPATQSNPVNEILICPFQTFTTNGVNDTPFTIPANADVHALGISINGLVGASSFGTKISIRGVNNFLYYEGRPLANLIAAAPRNAGPPYLPTFFIVAYSTLTDPTFTLGLDTTGGQSSIELAIIGYTAAIPPFFPPVVPSQFASAIQAGNGTSPLLAARTDGIEYSISSLSIDSFSSAAAGFFQTLIQVHGGSVVLYNYVKFGQTAAKELTPDKLVVPSLDLVNNGGGTETTAASVAYSLI